MATKESNRRYGMATAKKEKGKKVTFAYASSSAKEVMLAGSFNNWNYKITPLRKTQNNVWKKELTLQPGRYEYKFVVDGNWTSDPQNTNRSSNPYGTDNSIVEI